MSITAALAELEKSSALPDHVAYLQDVLAIEARRREQFHREFEGKRGEFINGQVFVALPARKFELDTIARVTALLHGFATRNKLGEVYGGESRVHCRRNDYEPDICFFSTAKVAEFTPDLLLFPPPDLAVEVLSPSTLDHDRKLKWQDYARHGVGEYWIVNADDRMVEQYVLPPGAKEYALKARLAGGGHLISVVLTGLDVPVATFFGEPETPGCRATGPVAIE